MNLTRISLRDFKCHAALDLPLAPLTVLTGMNSAGKSTVCQALALLRQSICKIGSELLLNGELVRLGTVGDVQNQSTDHDTFSINIYDDEYELGWVFSGDRRSSKAQLVEGVRKRLNGEGVAKFATMAEIDTDCGHIMSSLAGLEYLTILRRDPAELPAATDSNSENRLGIMGEGAIALLYENDQVKVCDQLCIEKVPPTLPRQVEAWMNQFFPGFAMEIQPADSGSEIIILRIRTELSGEFHLPSNVGYGPYYVLPVITAALLCKPGQILMVDSPEAHLHPACQNRIAQFLARVAATGVQIIVETHNDHFINGVRQAVKQKHIPPDSVLLHYFAFNDSADYAHTHRTISINSDGALDQWPPGFFDQYEQDLAVLAEWSS